MKPDARIFEIALGRAGVAAPEALLWTTPWPT